MRNILSLVIPDAVGSGDVTKIQQINNLFFYSFENLAGL